jgi:hypothetical protein
MLLPHQITTLIVYERHEIKQLIATLGQCSCSLLCFLLQKMSIPMLFCLNWHVDCNVLHASCIQVALKNTDALMQ